MGKIEGTGWWEVRIVGVMPPGVSPEAMKANIVSSIMTSINLQPWQRQFYVLDYATEPPVPQQPPQGSGPLGLVT